MLFLLLCFAVFSASGDEVSKQAKIEQFMQLTNTEEMARQQLQQMRAMFEAQAQKNSTEGSAKEVAGKIMDLMTQRLSWDRMRTGLVKIYTDLFTEEELDGIITFYKSPAGQAMLKKMPVLMQRGMQLGSEMMGDTQAEVKKIIEGAGKK